jgi:hypothetical protein
MRSLNPTDWPALLIASNGTRLCRISVLPIGLASSVDVMCRQGARNLP